jgi:hypothetical protein
MTDLLVRRWEARCWAELEPAKAVALYDDILREQPRVGSRAGSVLAYVASACAKSGELDRARAEASRALAIYKQTQSATAARELRPVLRTA